MKKVVVYSNDFKYPILRLFLKVTVIEPEVPQVELFQH